MGPTMELLTGFVRELNNTGNEEFLTNHRCPVLVAKLPKEAGGVWSDTGTDNLSRADIQQALVQSPEALRAIRKAEGMGVVKIVKSPYNRPGGPVVLGRARDSDVVILNSRVSRRHVQFEIQPDGSATIMDLGSNNGTHVNGRPLEPNRPELLQGGETVAFGEVETTFHTPHTFCHLVSKLLNANGSA